MYLSERSRMLEAVTIAINILKTNSGASAFNTILEGVKNGAIKDPVKTAEDLKNAAEVLGVELKPMNQEAIRQISEAMEKSDIEDFFKYVCNLYKDPKRKEIIRSFDDAWRAFCFTEGCRNPRR